MPKTRSQIGRRSRQKGAEYMRYIKRKLAVIWPFAAVRSQYTGGSKDGCDIEKTDYYIEVKNCARLSIPAWWHQLIDDKEKAKDDRPPALFFKIKDAQGRNIDLAAMRLDDFIQLTREERDLGRYGPDSDGGYSVRDERGLGFIGYIRPSRSSIDLSILGWHASRFWIDDQLAQQEEKVPNPRKGSNGLWSTLDDAEAAIRRACDD